MDTIPRIQIIGDEIVIRLSKSELTHLIENKPDQNYKVVDGDQLMKDFKHELENFAHSNATELGCSELQYLFDEIIDEVYVNATGSIEKEGDDE